MKYLHSVLLAFLFLIPVVNANSYSGGGSSLSGATELQQTTVTTFTDVPGLTTEFGNAGTVSLSAGEWDISAIADFQLNGATSTYVRLIISAYSGNTNTDALGGVNLVDGPPPTAGANQTLTIPSYHVTVLTTTTYYFKVAAAYSAGTPQFKGRISARRVDYSASSQAIDTLNGLTGTSQDFAVGTAGTDFAISSASTTHTFNLPSASATARGVVTTGAQTIAGVKTLSSAPILSALTASKPIFTDGSKATTSSGTLGADQGGTGVANNSAATLTRSGSHALTLTTTNTTGVTLPTTGTLSTVAGTETLVNKTLTAPVLNSATVGTQLTFGNYHLEPCETDSGNSGTSKTLDLATCAIQKSTLTGSVTYTLSNPVTGATYLIKIVQGASSYTVTWPGSVLWAGGTGPTITTTNGKTDLVNLYYDGTSYYGSFSQNY